MDEGQREKARRVLFEGRNDLGLKLLIDVFH